MVITNFFLMPLIFLGGVFYSIDMLPEFWQKVSFFNPVVYLQNTYNFVEFLDIFSGLVKACVFGFIISI